MRADLHIDGPSAVITLSGDLDAATEFMELVATALRSPGVTDLTIDLNDLAYIDSGGVNALLFARNECELNGANLTVAEPSDRVRRILTITGVDEFFTIKP